MHIVHPLLCSCYIFTPYWLTKNSWKIYKLQHSYKNKRKGENLLEKFFKIKMERKIRPLCDFRSDEIHLRFYTLSVYLSTLHHHRFTIIIWAWIPIGSCTVKYGDLWHFWSSHRIRMWSFLFLLCIFIICLDRHWSAFGGRLDLTCIILQVFYLPLSVLLPPISWLDRFISWIPIILICLCSWPLRLFFQIWRCFWCFWSRSRSKWLAHLDIALFVYEMVVGNIGTKISIAMHFSIL